MEFVQLTLDGTTGLVGLVVRADHIAYYQADVRTGPEGAFDCGVLYLKNGERLRVLEDLDQFLDRLSPKNLEE